MLDRITDAVRSAFRLAQDFNRAAADAPARNFNRPDAPFILVDIGNDDPTRGDTRGRTGLAREIARQTGGRMDYLDMTRIYKGRPMQEMLESPPERLYREYLMENGRPDIVLGGSYFFNVALDHSDLPGYTRTFDAYNEDLADHYLCRTHGLVAHHLTPAALKEKGAAFRAAHPDIGGPLVAVMVSAVYDETAGALAANIERVTRAMSNPVIFVCASHRSGRFAADLAGRLATLAARHPRADGSAMQVKSWEYNPRDPANPYIGLLATADHFILAGESRSMMSEILSTGKTVHLYDHAPQPFYGLFSPLRTLESKRYVRTFNAVSLDTRAQAPLNLTQDLAAALIREFEKGRARFDAKEAGAKTSGARTGYGEASAVAPPSSSPSQGPA